MLVVVVVRVVVVVVVRGYYVAILSLSAMLSLSCGWHRPDRDVVVQI